MFAIFSLLLQALVTLQMLPHLHNLVTCLAPSHSRQGHHLCVIMSTLKHPIHKHATTTPACLARHAENHLQLLAPLGAAGSSLQLLVHVVELCQGWATDVEQHPASDRQEHGQDDGQAVVTSS